VNGFTSLTIKVIKIQWEVIADEF